MSESVRVFTVPDDWTHKSSLASNSSEAIVGTVTPQGDELWLPHEKHKYFFGGGYSTGYSPLDVRESIINLSDDMSSRFTNFFKKLLLGEEWSDVGRRAEKYDCHWFANWLDGQVDPSNTVIDTVRMAKGVVREGVPTEGPIGLGEIGVLTRISKNRGIYPVHSFVGTDEDKAVHAMGLHGKLAISPQEEIFEYYAEHCIEQPISDFAFEDPNKLELYTTSSNL